MTQEERFEFIDHVDSASPLHKMLAHQGRDFVDQLGTVEHGVGFAQSFDGFDYAFLSRARNVLRRL